MKILVLGETAEAAALTQAALRARRERRIDIAPTLATDPVRARANGEFKARGFSTASLPSGCRRGGVKGAEGLITALQWDRYRVVVEAAHPFDAETRLSAAAACRALGVPLLQLHRPLWRISAPGRRAVADVQEAARRAVRLSRSFLWIGLDRIAPFSERRDLWTLTRAFAPQPGRYPLPRGDYAVGEGPFTQAHEATLLSDYRISELILENSGAAMAEPMLAAAAAKGCGATLIAPPEPPEPGPNGARVGDAEAALDWLGRLR